MNEAERKLLMVAARIMQTQMQGVLNTQATANNGKVNAKLNEDYRDICNAMRAVKEAAEVVDVQVEPIEEGAQG